LSVCFVGAECGVEFKRYLALKSIDYVIQFRTARWQYCG